MAIESLGGAMSYQVQPTVKPQVTTQTPVLTTEGQGYEGAPMVDSNTVAVAKVGEQQREYQDPGSDAGRNQATAEQLRKAVEEINRKATHTTAQFGVHEATNRITIKIVDRDTKKVIKELPPEKTLDMIAKAWELAGILVDEKR